MNWIVGDCVDGVDGYQVHEAVEVDGKGKRIVVGYVVVNPNGLASSLMTRVKANAKAAQWAADAKLSKSDGDDGPP